MEKENSVSFKVYGRQAMFSDPITRTGGEKCSYHVPTYQALKGILESVYWKPTFIWVIDSVKIIKPIKTRSTGVRPISYNGGNTLSIYTYLTDVEYWVKAHFIWNEQRPELAEDRNENKHFFIAKRMIEKGGRRDVFLGTRECQAYVEPCEFHEGVSFYEDIPELAFGLMFHSFSYPDENSENEFKAMLWNPVMKRGQIDFYKQNECPVIRTLNKKDIKTFSLGENLLSCEEEIV